MKKIYLAVFIILVSSVFLFAGSLLYLDKEKHKTYFYTTSLDGHDIGSVEVNKYVTDDKIIYKSLDSEPFRPFFTESRSRITLDKNGSIMSYSKEAQGAGVQDTIYLEKIDDNISFVATSGSEFACLTGLPIKNQTFVFEEDSPVTYLPILERYDFNFGILICPE